MLVCAPFHSVANPPVGMAYLASYLGERGIDCRPRDINIEAREFVRALPGPDGKPGAFAAIADDLFALARRTYLGEAAAWSWFDSGGLEAVAARALNHPVKAIRDFWRGAEIERLVSDGALRHVSAALHDWLLRQAEAIAGAAAGWVGFSTTITNFAPTLFLARRMRELDPDLLLIIGGPHISARNAAQILRACRVFDFAVPTPAFAALESLLADIGRARHGPLPPGVWRARREATSGNGSSAASAVDIECGSGQVRMDLNALPPADWTWARLSRYDSGFLMKNTSGDFTKWYPTIPVQTSRGCSYSRCKFCHNVVDYPKYSMQRPERVAQEVRHQIATVGSRGFFFTDDEFSGSRRRTVEIGRELRALDEEVRYSCWVRLDKIDAELLDDMYAAGARQLFIGVEAVDDDILLLMDKGYGSREALRNLKLLYQFADRHPDLVYVFNLIVDYPGETLASVRRTLAVVAENPELFVGKVAACCVFHLYEGTPAFEQLGDGATACIDPLLPADVTVPDLRYLYPPVGVETRPDRMEIWSAIAEFVRFKEPHDHGHSRNTVAIYD
ncbi:MAG: radical SAM protein [Hyphomicrobiales bacterium]|nr:radical SAM protein [Hyphomicrobiales bacterium]MBV8823456.1 radical SAM protein [Hyphomicrobiales bacterium]